MPRSVPRTRRLQPSLFHPAPPRPDFHTLPPEIQDKTIRLLARLLRLEIERRTDKPQEKNHE